MGTSKKCTKCGVLKLLKEFCKRSISRDGLNYKCRACDKTMNDAYKINNVVNIYTRTKKWKTKNQARLNEAEGKRRARLNAAIPIWMEIEKIKSVYKKASKFKLEVDHIVPIASDFVCGLHCWDNLQLLDKKLNSGKGNRMWPDMWGETI